MAEEYDLWADTEDFSSDSPTSDPGGKKPGKPGKPKPVVPVTAAITAAEDQVETATEAAENVDTGDVQATIDAQIAKMAAESKLADAEKKAGPKKTRKIKSTYAEKDPSYLRVAAEKYFGVERPEQTEGGFGGFTMTKASDSERKKEGDEEEEFRVIDPLRIPKLYSSKVRSVERGIRTAPKRALISHEGSSLRRSTHSPGVKVEGRSGTARTKEEAHDRLKTEKEGLKVGHFEDVVEDGKKVRRRVVDPETGRPTPTIPEQEAALADMERALIEGLRRPGELEGGTLFQAFGIIPSEKEDWELRQWRNLSAEERAMYPSVRDTDIKSHSDLPRMFKTDLRGQRDREWELKQEDFDKIRAHIQTQKNRLAAVNHALLLVAE